MPPTERTRRSFGHLRQLQSKRWQAKFNGPDSKTYNAPMTFDTPAQAEAWLEKERDLINLAERLGQQWVSPTEREAKSAAKAAAKPITFREYAPEVLAARKVELLTRDLYEGDLRRYLYDTFGDMPLADITEADVVRWYDAMMGTRTQDGKGKPIPTATANAYGLLKSILGVAVERGLINRNPCTIRGGSKKPPVRDYQVLTAPEVATLAAAMPEHLRLAVSLGTFVILRRGELFELRRKDLLHDCTELRVGRSYWSRGGKSGVKPPKNGEAATVIIPPHIRAAVKDHLATHVRPGKDALLFPDPATGGHYNEWSYRRIWRRATEAIGKPGLRLHDLRHSGGTIAAHAGGTLAEIMAMGRWKSPQAAMRYQRIATGRMATMAENMSKLANG